MNTVALHHAPAEQRLPAPIQAMTPVDMLSIAVTNGASIEILERLITLQERWRAGEARRAFESAIAAAKAEIKPIPKTRNVGFNSAKGSTNYDYEGLDDIANMVDPALAKNGLSYRHRALQDGNHLTITCVLTHKDGHFEETTLGANNDTSGNKNPIQAVGSVATYLQRYTVKLALGLATTKDNDGQGTGERRPHTQTAPKAPPDTIDAEFASPEPEQQFAAPEMITAAQVAQLRTMADEAGVDHAKLCAFFSIADFADIPAIAFDKVAAAIAKKRQRATSPQPPAEASTAGEPASSSPGTVADDAGTPDPIAKARAAGRKACRAGVPYDAVPKEFSRYILWGEAWQDGHAEEGEKMEAEVRQ